MGRVEHATPPISSHGWHWVASVANVRVAVSMHVQVFRGFFFYYLSFVECIGRSKISGLYDHQCLTV